MEQVLELHGLAKEFQPGLFKRKVIALRGLDLTVRRGETYGFLGVNGAGKTTTFKILLGLLRPTAGGGHLLGRPLGDRAARQRLGFLPELPAYYPHLTAGELLGFARALSGVARDSKADASLLADFGLEGMRDRPVRRLSKGQLQRLGIAQALVHDPELLILDEPMSGLDPIGRALVKDRLRRERARGRTLLLSSHVLSDVESLADSVGLLSGGRLQIAGSPRELLASSVEEVILQGSGPLPSEPLSGMPAGSSLSEVGPEEWVLRLPHPEPFQVDACLRRVLAAGGRVLGVETRREDLEDFFLRAVQGGLRACGS